MGLGHQVAVAIGQALGNVHAGGEKLAARKLGLGPPTIKVTSILFRDGEPLPASSTVEGRGFAPPLEWRGIPGHAESIVVIAEDPDAPFPRPFVHWIVFDIAPTSSNVTGAAVETSLEGKNSNLKTGFAGAAPPPGHGKHHYHFQVFALDTTLDLDAGAGRGVLLERMKGHVLAWGEIVGTYERK